MEAEDSLHAVEGIDFISDAGEGLNGFFSAVRFEERMVRVCMSTTYANQRIPKANIGRIRASH
jgi:hypothetical protein